MAPVADHRDHPPSSAVADVLALGGLAGSLTPPLVPIVTDSTVRVGRAVTVRFAVADEGPGLTALYNVLSRDLSDCAVLMTGLSALDGAAFGEILATAAHHRGARIMLVDGAVRDAHNLDALGLPVYARSLTIAGPNRRAHVVAVDETAWIDDVAVHPDDAIVADKEGCVVVPLARLAEILDCARSYADAEDRLRQTLESGASLAESYRIKKEVVDDIRARLLH